jgi:hypothetical protein
MLTEYNQITFKDKKKKYDTICEINLPGEKKDVIKIQIDGRESYITIKDFYGVCLMLVKGNLIDDLLPNVERKVNKYKRQIKVIAQKDIKKGEEIIVTYEVDVPKIITDNYKENAKN